MTPMFCPRCTEAVVVQTVAVRYQLAPNLVPDQIVMCTACAWASQVMSETGQLIDMDGHWEVGDLCHPLMLDYTFITTPPLGRLFGRRDS